MLFLVAKVVQLVGMATVGYGLFVGLTSERGMTEELRLLLAGSLIFMGGWFMQRRSQQH